MSTLDNNLQQSKTKCLGMVESTWSNTDAFTLDLDNNLMLLLIEKSKARVFSRIKQVRDADAEKTTRRLETRAFANKDRLRGNAKFPDFGR
jgi:hypothetical protein